MAGMKGKQSVRDMVLSLGLIGIVAGFIYVFIPNDDSEPPLKRVDYRVELLTARRAAAYPVAAPEGLSKQWKATSVRFQGADFDAWHLGFHDPDGEYVAIEQSTQKPVTFIDDASQGAEETNKTQRIGERSWQRYEGAKYDALVLKEKGSTTVVTGTASFAQLTKMAGALKTEQGPYA
ncbi:DUF4245 domain-containing protein [Streptomyces phaeochromogenes]|uniref:DUF4245 domain-containing protein n=1 Tax=Streptomyces phaeochromogenes TaxID=1923 RepID=UPI0033DA134B